MSVATPTALPRPPLFPALMPRPQQPYPTPLAVPGRRAGRLILRRDLVQEMDDLSDEEAELDDSVRLPTLSIICVMASAMFPLTNPVPPPFLLYSKFF